VSSGSRVRMLPSESGVGRTPNLAIEPILVARRPDAVIVFGDTNSTLAGALAAAKLQIPVAHVEAGLRSFDRRMPEELNRVVADHLAHWSFAPTPTAVANLAAEGVSERVVLAGDLMQDLVARLLPEIRESSQVLPAIAARIGLDGGRLRPGGYVFATIHRAENREIAAMRAWVAILGSAARVRPVVLALHPGTRTTLERARIAMPSGIVVIEPQGYRTTLALQLHAAAVLTDSGGVQREAAWLGVPCLVLRGTTEWIEAVEASAGRMVVVGLDGHLAAAELERLVPPRRAEASARERAAKVAIPPAGAALTIAATLADAAGSLSPRRDGNGPRIGR
jgi:UDP-GlcNAc3NAcA epimerase